MPFLGPLVLKPTPERFMRWMKESLSRQAEGQFQEDPSNYSLRLKTGGNVVFLGNLFQDFQNASRFQRPRLLSHWARIFTASGSKEGQDPTLEEALPKLLPRVRDRIYHELMPLYASQVQPAFQVFARDFTLSLVLDFPDRVVEVGSKQLESWGQDFDSLLVKARENLLALSEQGNFLQIEPGLYRSNWQDTHDASRIMVPGLLRELEVRGTPIAVLPNRNTLLVTGDQNPENLKKALHLAQELIKDEPRPQNACPLRLNGAVWEPFEVPKDHPLSALLKEVRAECLAHGYADQKAVLDESHGKQQKDIFVASHQIVRTPSGDTFSYAIWGAGFTEGWLPRVDRVVLMQSPEHARDALWIPWDTLLQECAQGLEPLGLYPERWRFTRFPDPEQLEVLRPFSQRP